MSRLFVVLNLAFLVTWLRGVQSQLVELQPWKAAEAALTALPESISLRAIDSRSLEVFCGHRVKLGLEVDDRMYDVMIGNEADFSKLEIPELTDKKGAVSESLISEVMVDACALPDVTLAGPLEIEWTQPSWVKLRAPPEPYIIANIKHVVIEDGAHVKLSGLKELQLQDPISLGGLTEAYLNEVYGKRSDQRLEQTLGLMHISAALQQEARDGTGTVLKLQATSASSGFSLHQLREHPIRIIEASPGTVSISPSKSERSSGQVEQLWMWPLPDASMSDLIPYEALLKEVLSNHWPEVHPDRSSLILQTAHLSAATLLHLEMEVRSETGQTQILDAHILMDEAGQYIPVNAQLVNSGQYTTTISKSAILDLMHHNFTADPELPLYDIYV